MNYTLQLQPCSDHLKALVELYFGEVLQRNYGETFHLYFIAAWLKQQKLQTAISEWIDSAAVWLVKGKKFFIVKAKVNAN